MLADRLSGDAMAVKYHNGYCAGIKDAICAVLSLNGMTVSQVHDCLGVSENTLEYIIPQVDPIKFVEKINEWVNKPHWIPNSDMSCKWATAECSKCRQGGFPSWNYCPNCGTKMNGVVDDDGERQEEAEG